MTLVLIWSLGFWIALSLEAIKEDAITAHDAMLMLLFWPLLWGLVIIVTPFVLLGDEGKKVVLWRKK
jgi:hypothetical protein